MWIDDVKQDSQIGVERKSKPRGGAKAAFSASTPQENSGANLNRIVLVAEERKKSGSDDVSVVLERSKHSIPSNNESVSQAISPGSDLV